MTVRAVRAAAALLIVGAVASGCASASGRTSDRAGGPPDSRLVLVSGRDDHGELALGTVPLYGSPPSDADAGPGERVAGVPDGTPARVLAVEGQWLRVRPVTSRTHRAGWVDDYYLRGVVHVLGPPPSCRPRLAGALREAGLQAVMRDARGGRVLVEAVTDPAVRGWVARSDVQELAPEPGDCLRGARPAS